MEDGDTKKYHVSSMIQDVVFSRRKKWVVSGVFHRRYIIKLFISRIVREDLSILNYKGNQSVTFFGQL